MKTEKATAKTESKPATNLYDCLNYEQCAERVNSVYYKILSGSLGSPKQLLEDAYPNFDNPTALKQIYNGLIYHLVASHQTRISNKDYVKSASDSFNMFVYNILVQLVIENREETVFFAQTFPLACSVMEKTHNRQYIPQNATSFFGSFSRGMSGIGVDDLYNQRLKSAINQTITNGSFLNDRTFDAVSKALSKAFVQVVGTDMFNANQDKMYVLNAFNDYHKMIGSQLPLLFYKGNYKENKSLFEQIVLTDEQKLNFAYVKRMMQSHVSGIAKYAEQTFANADQHLYNGEVEEWTELVDEWFSNPQENVVYDYILNYHNQVIRVVFLTIASNCMKNNSYTDSQKAVIKILIDKINSHPLSGMVEQTVVATLVHRLYYEDFNNS